MDNNNIRVKTNIYPPLSLKLLFTFRKYNVIRDTFKRNLRVNLLKKNLTCDNYILKHLGVSKTKTLYDYLFLNFTFFTIFACLFGSLVLALQEVFVLDNAKK